MRLRAFPIGLAGLVLLGVAIRVYYTVRVAPWPPDRLDDEIFYNVEPLLIAKGQGFSDVAAAVSQQPARPTAAHPPLYPVVLAGLAKLGAHGQEAQRLMGVAFGAGTIATLGVLGRRLAGDRVGLIAAALAALYPMLITADGALMSESLLGLLVALSLLAAYRLHDAPDPARAVVLGVLLGLAALTRGEALLLVGLLLVPIWRAPGGRRAAVICACAALVVIVPWSVRNWTAFDRPVLISTTLSSAVAGANCHSTYYGGDIGSWDLGCIKAHPGNEAVALDRARGDALRYAGDHVTRLPVVAAARVARVWGVSRTLEGRHRGFLEAGAVMYLVLLPLAAYGFVLLRRRRTPVWILMTPFILVTVTALLIYGDVRFREPAELSLVVLAAVGLERGASRPLR